MASRDLLLFDNNYQALQHSNTVWGNHYNNSMMSRALISHTKETTEI